MTGPKHRKINTVFDYDDALNKLEEEHDQKAEAEKQQRESREKLLLQKERERREEEKRQRAMQDKLLLQKEREKKEAEILKAKSDEIEKLINLTETLEKYISSFDSFGKPDDAPQVWLTKCRASIKNLEEGKEEKVSVILALDGQDQFYLEKKGFAEKKLDELELKLNAKKGKISTGHCFDVINNLCGVFQDMLGARKKRINDKIKELQDIYKREKAAFEKKYEANSPSRVRHAASPTSPLLQASPSGAPKSPAQSVANARASTFARAGADIAKERSGQAETKRSNVNKGGS